MINILIIVPYPEMHEKVEAVLREHPPRQDLRIRVETAAVEETLHMDISGCDAVIARGFTADSMEKRHPDLPVIRMMVSGYDIARALDECRTLYHPEKIAVCGFGQQFFEVNDLSAALGICTKVYASESYQEIPEMIRQAAEDGCDALIGGYSANKAARRAGLPAVVIRTGEDAVIKAIDEAVRTVERVRTERITAQMYKTTIYSSSDGILYVDSKGIIRVRNHVVRRMNGERSLMNRPLADTFPFLKDAFTTALRTQQEASGLIFRLPATGLTVSASFRPVVAGGETAGIVITLTDITKIQRLEEQIRRKLSERGLQAKYSFDDILYESDVMRQAVADAKKYAATDANVIIVGETGTGKELFAQSIHRASGRSKGPFVVINCAALPENLLESELFGYSEGAFTGAVKGGKMGLFEQAHGGTLFLDEIEEIPLSTQTKLLRVLQERQVRRIGDSRVIDINVRILSATNISIRQLVDSGRFRGDLMYRLDVLRLYVPPLRERGSDKELLFDAFLDRACRKSGLPVPSVRPDALPLLRTYPFAGNIRELNNIIERICAVNRGETLLREDLEAALYPRDLSSVGRTGDHRAGPLPDASENPEYKSPAGQNSHFHPSVRPPKRNNEAAERERILAALEECGGSRQEAADLLGVNRSTLWRKMQKYGLS